MKLLSTFILFTFISIQLHAQVINGKVLDAASGKSLEYVNIGIIDTPLGTITDGQGVFSLDTKGQPLKAVVRISMIGYKPQIFTLEDLFNKESIIKLVNEPIQLGEVTVKPFLGKLKKVGITSKTAHGGLCGIGGTQRGRGHEIGTKIELGATPVLLRALHINVHNQSFDCSLFRLHIRSIVGNLPSEELLTENIILPLTKKSGWAEIDLSKYNLIFSGDIALTLEWVAVSANGKPISINGKKEFCILFNREQKQGYTFTKWGSEAKWSNNPEASPSFYLAVQE